MNIERKITVDFANAINNINFRLVEIEKTKNKELLNEIIQSLTISFVDYKEMTQSILDILENKDQAKILKLIGVENIFQGIGAINSELKENQTIPSGNNEFNAVENLKISKTKLKFRNQRIEIELKVPISIGAQPLSKIFPTPIKYGGGRYGLIQD